MAFDKTFWKRYKKALQRTKIEDNNLVENWILKFPRWIALGVLILTSMFIWAMWSSITYIPPPPLPLMNLSGFYNALTTVQFPAILWIIFFLFLWLTKW